MQQFVLFFNELSCQAPGLSLMAIKSHLLTSIEALRALVALRSNVALRISTRISEIVVGDLSAPLGKILSSERDERLFLFRRMDLDPGSLAAAGVDEEVCCNSKVGIGLSRASWEKSLVLSIGHEAPWSEHLIPAIKHSLDAQGMLLNTSIEVGNIAKQAHVECWKREITDYGLDLSKTSLLFRGNGFVLRMYFKDHDPPHLHVYERSDDVKTLLAKVCINNCDILYGRLDSGKRKEIVRYINEKRSELLENWRTNQNRC